jgi:hypothetical protein
MIGAPRRTLALVESPTQLLNVIEWAHREPSSMELRVFVLPPTDEQSLVQLERVGWLATMAGLSVQVVDARRRSGAGLAALAQLAREVSRASRLVIGDPFSGLIQTVLPLARASHVIIVDDGTATWDYAASIDAQRPLVRWQLASTEPARAVRATRLLTASDHRRITVFSCLADAAPQGARLVSNTYQWTRSRSDPELRAGQVDVVGVSLVDTGVIEAHAYIAAVGALAKQFGAVRYLAHRREGRETLAGIAALSGVHVVRSEIPIEVALSQGPVAEHVVIFPSTAAYTLPIVLAGTGVRLEVRRVEAAWFTAAATPRTRDFVKRIADDAALPPVLELA